jgi:hypothetical protein
MTPAGFNQLGGQAEVHSFDAVLRQGMANAFHPGSGL